MLYPVTTFLIASHHFAAHNQPSIHRYRITITTMRLLLLDSLFSMTPHKKIYSRSDGGFTGNSTHDYSASYPPIY